jgi:redox-sensitive bicupin YhaK (pirin superfamily)
MTFNRVERAASMVGPVVRDRAFRAGAIITYVEDGKILQVSQDGSVVVVGPTSAHWVTVSQRRWVLSED